jgi:hypothetical protein
MVKKVLLAVLAAVVGVPLLLLAAGATRPERYAVTRSAVVAAPPEAVYATVVDFHRWNRWSPWAGLDPNQRETITGEGVGAVYAWAGNDKVGEGRMTMTGALKDDLVQIKLEFLKPWEQTSETTFRLAPAGPGQTRVTWAMTGEHDFVGKLFALFMDMDMMVGGDFEKGLATLKKVAEE